MIQICQKLAFRFWGISGYTCLTVFGAHLFYTSLWIKTYVEQSSTCQKTLKNIKKIFVNKNVTEICSKDTGQLLNGDMVSWVI